MSAHMLLRLPPSEDPRLLKKLDELGANRVPHSGRTLRDHLAGTAALLEDWGCDEEVCIAGLFHSVYGTNAFSPVCLSGANRADLSQTLGERAERLVFLFSACDRPIALLRSLAGERLTDRSSGDLLHVSADELRDLLAIECANLLEQQAESSSFVAALRRLPIQERQALVGAAAANAV